MTAAVTDEPLPLLPSSPRDPSVLFNPLLAINGRAKVEIEIRNRSSSLGNFFTAHGVHLWDFDRSWFAALTEHYSSPLRLEEIYTWTRLERRLQGSANDILLMKGITQSAVHRKVQTRRVGGRDIKKFLSTLSPYLLTREGIFERWKLINLLVSRLFRPRYRARYVVLCVNESWRDRIIRIVHRETHFPSYRTMFQIWFVTKRNIRKAGANSFRKIYK